MALMRLLAADYPTLSAPHIGVSPHHPDSLALSVHGDLGAFEAWREALGIDPDTVRRNTQSADTTLVLSGSTIIADARVQLIGYAPNLALVAVAAA
jgi:hypothetical protein